MNRNQGPLSLLFRKAKEYLSEKYHHQSTVNILKGAPFVLFGKFHLQLSKTLYRTIWRHHPKLLSEWVATTLGESLEQARHIAFESTINNIRFWTDYALLAYGRESYSKKRAIKIQCPDKSVLTYAGNTSRPLIILSIHMGNYLSGIIEMLKHLNVHNRACLVFRLLEESELEQKAYRHLRSQVKSFEVARLTDKNSLLKAVRLLRAGGVVATMADLPRSFGPTREVTLFGYPCDLVQGPAYLAVLSEAIILPVAICRNSHGVEILSFGTPIDGKKKSGEQRDDAVARIMQETANNIEGYVRKNPEQWLMWPLVNQYLSKSLFNEAP